MKGRCDHVCRYLTAVDYIAHLGTQVKCLEISSSYFFVSVWLSGTAANWAARSANFEP
jgi:hypothetical protein